MRRLRKHRACLSVIAGLPCYICCTSLVSRFSVSWSHRSGVSWEVHQCQWQFVCRPSCRVHRLLEKLKRHMVGVWILRTDYSTLGLHIHNYTYGLWSSLVWPRTIALYSLLDADWLLLLQLSGTWPQRKTGINLIFICANSVQANLEDSHLSRLMTHIAYNSFAYLRA